MKNKIEDLRNHLFETLDALKDEEKPMDLDRARAVADVARVIVDTAKAEVEFLKVTGRQNGTGFIPVPAIAPGDPRGRTPVALPSPTEKPRSGMPYVPDISNAASVRKEREARESLEAGDVQRRCPACSHLSAEDPCAHCGERIAA